MDQRENILKEALEKSVSETERWETYKKLNETTISNLKQFSKHLTVEIMVPIGKKALMPGELMHTNELLVGHYQGYFSSCSAHQAQEICRHRLRLADEHLAKLKEEAELWENKLAKPYLEGAVPSNNEIEIVEEYDEEAHNKWLKEHKERVRLEKIEERAKRQAAVNDEEVNNGELDMDTDEALRILMGSEGQETDDSFAVLKTLEAQEKDDIDISPEAEENLKATNEMVRNLMSNPSKILEQTDHIDQNQNDLSTLNEDTDPIPEEVKNVREMVALLSKEEHASFISMQLQIVREQLLKKKSEQNMDDAEIIRLLDIIVYLEDDLQELLYEESLEAPFEEDTRIENESEDTSEASPDVNTKRRISFATSEQKLEFRKDETVLEMLPNAKQHGRDVIALDLPLKSVQVPLDNDKDQTNFNETIVKDCVSPDRMERLKRNLEFVKENQSTQDFNLLDQIMAASSGRINTLHISFKHSNVTTPAIADHIDDEKETTPGSPADFYELYKKSIAQTEAAPEFPIYVHAYEGEDQVKVPIMKEKVRQSAYVDERKGFSKPEDSNGPSKSILRNKSAVQREPQNSQAQNKTKNRNKNKKQKSETRSIDDELREMSAYYKVMHDLVEKQPIKPDPLPEEEFIDSHTPKKRVSHFKENRAKIKM